MKEEKTKENKQRGFFKILGIFIVFVIIITFFNIDVASIVESDLFQGTLATIKKIIAVLYDFVANIIDKLQGGDTATTTTATSTTATTT